MTKVAEIELDRLPEGVRSRFIDGVNGLRIHILEAGFDGPNRPCVLLLHGFPELAYSWRKVMHNLASAGFHVIAPDQRGYGRTTGWNHDYEGDLAPFHILNLVRDALALVFALERNTVAAVVGHDFGSPVAAYCALTRPDVFLSVALMSAPFDGPPDLQFGPSTDEGRHKLDMNQQLAALSPPKKHYQHYFCTLEAGHDMVHCRQGLSNFLRAYFHCKSGDWASNEPSSLHAWSASELIKMPAYYIMDLHAGMPESVAALLPSVEDLEPCHWLSEDELLFYAQEFERTGFQGGLNWYRCSFREEQNRELSLYHGRTIDVPACFIGGEKDWGVFQLPGALETMHSTACSNMKFVELVLGAGHWVQQEQPDQVAQLLMQFLSD